MSSGWKYMEVCRWVLSGFKFFLKSAYFFCAVGQIKVALFVLSFAVSSESSMSDVSVTSTGGAEYRVPLQLPDQISDYLPQLTLKYDSDSKNGHLGIAWNIDGLESSIERCTQNWAQDGGIRAIQYDREDKYCLNGERLMLSEGEYGADGSEYVLAKNRFIRLMAHGDSGFGPEYFELEDQAGNKHYFGNSESSNVHLHTGGPIRAWALSSIDFSDNTSINISYYKQDNYYVPQQWAVNKNGESPYTLHFSAESRNDKGELYAKEQLVYRHHSRFTSLEVRKDEQSLYELKLDYEEDFPKNLSRLSSFSQCITGECEEETKITWDSLNVGFLDKNHSVPSPVKTWGVGPPGDVCTREEQDYEHLFDFNGDGILDYLYIEPANNTAGTASPDYDQGTLTAVIQFSLENWSSSRSRFPLSVSGSPKDMAFVDIDGDGKVDVLSKASGGYVEHALYADISGDDGFTRTRLMDYTPVNTTLFNQESVSLDPKSFNFEYLDIDGDGLVDIVAIVEFYHQSLGSHKDVYVYRNTGSEFGSGIKWLSNIQLLEEFVDINSDGLMDAIYLKAGQYLYGMGLKNVSIAEVAGLSSRRFNLLDVNGDGLLDRLQPSSRSSHSVEVNIDGSFSASQDEVYKGTGRFDINGDDRADRLGSYYHKEEGKEEISIQVSGNVPRFSSRALNKKEFTYSTTIRYQSYKEVIDVNGDGKLDFAANVERFCYQPDYRHHVFSRFMDFGRVYVGYNNSGDVNHIKRLKKGEQTIATFEFAAITQDGLHQAIPKSEYPLQSLSRGKQVLQRITYIDPEGVENSEEFTYEGFKRNLQFPKAWNGGDLGFKSITRKNLTQDTVTRTHYLQDYVSLGKVEKIDVRQASTGNMLKQEEMEHEVQGNGLISASSSFVKQHTVSVYSTLDGGVLNTEVKKYELDENGVVREFKNPIVVTPASEACKRPGS